MPEHPTDAHFSFTFVFKQALIIASATPSTNNTPLAKNNCAFVVSKNFRKCRLLSAG